MYALEGGFKLLLIYQYFNLVFERPCVLFSSIVRPCTTKLGQYALAKRVVHNERRSSSHKKVFMILKLFSLGSLKTGNLYGTIVPLHDMVFRYRSVDITSPIKKELKRADFEVFIPLKICFQKQ